MRGACVLGGVLPSRPSMKGLGLFEAVSSASYYLWRAALCSVPDIAWTSPRPVLLANSVGWGGTSTAHYFCCPSLYTPLERKDLVCGGQGHEVACATLGLREGGRAARQDAARAKSDPPPTGGGGVRPARRSGGRCAAREGGGAALGGSASAAPPPGLSGSTEGSEKPEPPGPTRPSRCAAPTLAV